MYNPGHFEESRAEVLHQLIREHPLGTLVNRGPEWLDANQLPFELDAAEGTHGVLRAHVARANPLWQTVQDGDEALVVFRAEQAYISPNWYPGKHASHLLVPTWNYRVVNVHGRIAIRDDEKYVRGLVARLTREHEAGTGDARPWRMSDAPPEHIANLLQAIVGIEITVFAMVGKFKLSQNRDTRDRLGAAEELRRRGNAALADAMRDA
ncbi:MAG: FMN-binding negative transcriptional regulator [Pseudomonadota bacterium]|nr:FMN-binding negative transcriptional regulator [Pseudomonadota bacterium]